MSLDFTKHSPSVPHEFKLKTNMGCSSRVIVLLLNDMVALDQGRSTFVVARQIKIGFMVTFKLFTPDMLKVIVFNADGIEVVTRCTKHDNAFTMNP